MKGCRASSASCSKFFLQYSLREILLLCEINISFSQIESFLIAHTIFVLAATETIAKFSIRNLVWKLSLLQFVSMLRREFSWKINRDEKLLQLSEKKSFKLKNLQLKFSWIVNVYELLQFKLLINFVYFIFEYFPFSQLWKPSNAVKRM